MNHRRLFFILLLISVFISLLTTSSSIFAQTTVFVNEIHYDNSGTDSGEAVEIAGPAGTDLTGWNLVLYNGSNGLVYDTTALNGVLPDFGNGFGTMVVSYPTNGIQNGAPDGMALVDASNTVIQFLSYEGSLTAVDGPAIGLLSEDIGVSESSGTAVGASLQLTGSGMAYEDFTWATEQPHTFGAINTGQSFIGAPSAPMLVINEVDYDQPSSDTAEYIEVKNIGASAADLSTISLELVNGTGGGAAIYNTITFPAVTLAPGDYFVVCGDSANVPNCDLDASPDSNLVQNGAPDGIGLRHNSDLLDAVSYEGDTGAPYTEGSGVGLVDDANTADMSISRCADGADTDQNNLDFVFTGSTPGAANICGGGTADIIINEVDADQTSTDSAEFVELYDGGIGNADLSGLALVFYNGSSDTVYNAFDLDGYSTDGDGYFVLCGDAGNVANCDLDVSPDTNLIQNGADAVALYAADASDFPSGTAVTTDNLVDALVYDTDDGDDAGLLVLLNAGQPQVNEAGAGDSTLDSNQRCANGSGGARNTDTYAQYAPTPGEENVCQIVVQPLSCTDNSTITMIHDVQGNGLTSPLVGATVVIDGVVVGDFQNNGLPDNGDLNGFYVQEEDNDADGNTATSEGVFVFAPGGTDVNMGDHVRVRGDVSEFSTSGGASLMTELSNVEVAVCTAPAIMPTATAVTLPVTVLTDFERYEGMLVTFPQALTISEYFNFDRFGEIVLTLDRLYQGTAVAEPGAAANSVTQANTLAKITIDDGRSTQNPDPAIHPNGNVFDLDNLFRGGDLVQAATGVMDDTFGLYRLQPTQGANYSPVNVRPATPDATGGSVTVASFNVLNYFTTIDTGPDICGPASNQDCRGADTPEELVRQRTKILAALVAIDADVVGLIELENHATDAALQDLVTGLNDALGAGTYAYIATGPIGTDAIKVAIIYKPATVTPAGGYAVLDSSVDSRFIDTKNRPVLAQTFQENANGALFTVAINHLKSKGSACDDVGDPDTGDGAGNCNLTRQAAAQALVDWLATDPTGSGDPDFLIMGDLNSYDKEDPIDAIIAGADDVLGSSDDYADLIFQFQGELAYSYVFDGQVGYLDYALANAALTPQVTGVTEWHINADEPDILDYDMSFKQDAQDALYEPNAFRASDHDPVIVGLNLNAAPDCSTAVPSLSELWPANHTLVAIDVLGVADPDGDEVTITVDAIFQDEAVDAPGSGHTAPDGTGLGSATAQVRAERAGGGNGRVYHIFFTASDEHGNSCSGEVLVSVPRNQGNNGAAVDDGAVYDSTLMP